MTVRFPSFPSWERGLKLENLCFFAPLRRSFPSWERGLKPDRQRGAERLVRVVPLVGTWIETALNAFWRSAWFVVPLVGTWIETIVAAL